MKRFSAQTINAIFPFASLLLFAVYTHTTKRKKFCVNVNRNYIIFSKKLRIDLLGLHIAKAFRSLFSFSPLPTQCPQFNLFH